jgi:ketosteroid isomerase-like protein
MSRENVELVTAFFDAYNARDTEAVDRLLAPDAEVTTLSARAGLAARWERGATQRYFEQLDEAWADLRVEIDECRELDDCVVALGRMRGTGKASQAEVVLDIATVFIVEDSRLVRVDTYSDPKAALEAARAAAAGARHQQPRVR